MNKYTEQELLANLWQDHSLLGFIEAKKAIDFDNLVLVVSKSENAIEFSKGIKGLTKNEVSYEAAFEKNSMNLYELKSFTLFGLVQDPITITKEELTSLLDDFRFDFKNAPTKSNNFTSKKVELSK